MNLYLFGIALCLGASAFFVLAWSILDGQYKNNDDDRNRPLEAEDKYI